MIYLLLSIFLCPHFFGLRKSDYLAFYFAHAFRDTNDA